MAGAKDNIFSEKLTPYIQNQLHEIESTYGKASSKYKGLELQYLKSPSEDIISELDRPRHYQAEVYLTYNGVPLKGVERLYRRTILIEPSSVCAAHCRWCLRGQYPLFSLRPEELTNFAKYCGSPEVKDDVREILITGGDPFMVPLRLEQIFADIKKYAPNIEIIRIGTRVPLQDPNRVNSDLMEILKKAAPIRVEIGTHINHPVELTHEARTAFKTLMNVVSRIYDQTVLLKGVNDEFTVLSELYDELRYIGIESHYLFHCIPMRGMSHHRTTIQKGLDLISRLTSSGAFSGRAKPMFTTMTDLGKITLYHGSLIERNARNEVLLQSRYRIEDFKYRNPSWQIPKAASVDQEGFLRVWYPDGKE